MEVKHKTCDIRNWKKRLFLDISSTNIDTLVPSLYQCIETCSIEVFWLLSQPLLHLRFNLFAISKISATKVEQLYVTNTSQNKQETFLCEYPLHRVPLIIENAQQNVALQNTLLKHSPHFDCWNQPINMCMHVCYLDCHEAGLCCYLVIHILAENLLHPLQLFHFHLWPIYWLSLIVRFI
jgi:hypothetical protein